MSTALAERNWKAKEVYVNNAPNQWHVTSGKWGEASIAVVNTKENAQLFATAPKMLKLLERIERGACLQQIVHERCICYVCCARAIVSEATREP